MWRSILAVALVLLFWPGAASPFLTLPEQPPSLTPGQVVQEFLTDLSEGGGNFPRFVTSDFQKYGQGMGPCFPDALVLLLRQGIGCGGQFHKISILEEKLEQDTARVKAKVVCPDRSVSVDDYSLKMEHHSWKIDFESLIEKIGAKIGQSGKPEPTRTRRRRP